MRMGFGIVAKESGYKMMQTNLPQHKLCTNPAIPRASDMQCCTESK